MFQIKMHCIFPCHLDNLFYLMFSYMHAYFHCMYYHQSPQNLCRMTYDTFLKKHTNQNCSFLIEIMWLLFFFPQDPPCEEIGKQRSDECKKETWKCFLDAPSDAPSLQASVPLCNIIHLSVSKIYDLLLTNRTWQGWLDIMFVSKSH